MLFLTQTVLGGAGGSGSLIASGGLGGNASSTLNYSHLVGESTAATVNATGGVGGGAAGGLTGNGGTALANLNLSGLQEVTATQNATGGLGGSVAPTFTGNGGLGGIATVGGTATSTGAFAVSSTSTVIGR